MRILGLDIGEKRIGVAVSDELGLTAQGLNTLAFKDFQDALSKIVSLCKDYAIEEIVVGMPFNMNGTEGTQVHKVRGIATQINESTNVPIREWDERLSTVAAERTLLEADVSRAKRRKVIDKLAAVLILQGYLDRNYSRRRLTE